MEKEISDEDALRVIAKELVATLAPTDTATLITLSGELGAGKTTFSQMVGEELGVTETMASPTFVLEKIYDLTDVQGFQKLVHIDAYRLKGEEELALLGWSRLLEEPGNIILLEWPEMVAEALPKHRLAITLTVREDGTRTYNSMYA